MSLHLLKKTGSLYYGFHATIGEETYLVHPEGTEDVPSEVLAQFTALVAMADLQPILAIQEGKQSKPIDPDMIDGDIYIKPTSGMPAGFRTHHNGRVYIVDEDAEFDAPQALVDAFEEFMIMAGNAAPSSPQVYVNQGEARFEREDSTLLPDAPDPNAVPTNWDQKPLVNVPNLVGTIPAQPIQREPEGKPDVQIPTLSFTGGLTQQPAEQPAPVDPPAPTPRKRGGKAQSDDPTKLAPGEQIITGE